MQRRGVAGDMIIGEKRRRQKNEQKVIHSSKKYIFNRSDVKIFIKYKDP